MHQLIGHCKCAKRKAKLQELIQVTKIILQTKLFERGDNLNDVFMRFYEITGFEDNTLEGWMKQM